VGAAATGALVVGLLVAGTAVGAETVAGAGVGDPQAANSRPLINTINVNEFFVLAIISLPFSDLL
jgi:hypothetical protein